MGSKPMLESTANAAEHAIGPNIVAYDVYTPSGPRCHESQESSLKWGSRACPSERGVPVRTFSIGVHRMKLLLFEAVFTMFDDGGELRQRHKFVRLYEIFFLARSRCARV